MERRSGVSTFVRLWAAGSVALLVLAFAALPATAQTAPNAASADAYGALVDAQLLQQNIPVHVGPVSRATQEAPPQQPDAASAALVSVGPVPSDGSVVDHIGVVEATARATTTPVGTAVAETANIRLFLQNGQDAITADVVKAVANSSCTTDPNADGTTFVNLVVNGQPIGGAPSPNTVIDLGIAKVILNEQHPAADGRGIVVNAIHVVSTESGDALIRGDIIVSHAASTVNCENGPGSTGGSNDVVLSKSASPTTASRGDTVTYSATVHNASTADCIVNRLIEHLASPFTFVSTSGDFGDSLNSTEARPGGGTDLLLGNGTVIAAGDTKHQTFVVRVNDDAGPGVYFNNLEVLCDNIGDFVKGLDAPVTIVVPSTSPTASVTPSIATSVQARHLVGTGSNGLDTFLLLFALVNAGGSLIGFGALMRRAKARRS